MKDVFQYYLCRVLSLTGIIFQNLGVNVEYTIRLRHEVGSDNSWFTNLAGPGFELPGARVTPK